MRALADWERDPRAPIELRVHGIPAPQGSKTAYVRGTRPVLVEGGSKAGRASHAAWRQAVATAARDYQQTFNRPLLNEPTALDVVFLLCKPKTTPKYRLWPTTKPDLDKLVRATLDALTGVLLRDDCLVVRVMAEKVYGDPPGARLALHPLGMEEQARRAVR